MAQRPVQFRVGDEVRQPGPERHRRVVPACPAQLGAHEVELSLDEIWAHIAEPVGDAATPERVAHDRLAS